MQGPRLWETATWQQVGMVTMSFMEDQSLATDPPGRSGAKDIIFNIYFKYDIYLHRPNISITVKLLNYELHQRLMIINLK